MTLARALESQRHPVIGEQRHDDDGELPTGRPRTGIGRNRTVVLVARPAYPVHL